MIITDKFVFIHLPKTGGTFTQTAIRMIYKNKRHSISGSIKSLIGKEYCRRHHTSEKIAHLEEPWGQHGGANQIPEKYINHRKISIIRNPYDWYSSVYGFEWWRKNPKIHQELSFESYKSYPNISIEELIKTQNLLVEKHGEKLGIDLSSIGYLTWRFINTFFKNPEKSLLNLSTYKNDIRRKDWVSHMHDIEFISQENLNSELYQLLTKIGYKNIDFILELDMILPEDKGRNEGPDGWMSTINDTLKNEIRNKDKLIFELFPKYKLI